MSFVPLYRITNRMTAGLTQIERARAFLETGSDLTKVRTGTGPN